jgi:DNA-binding NarL/FixJ family response regulator
MTSEKMANGRKILIVEDEPLIAWSLADMIRTMGYEICGTVATEEAAVEGASGCDAVLMDFRLAGGGSGLAAARRIRENADMPIVFCTAYSEEAGLADQMLAVRRAALIPKPVSRAKLEQAFAQLFAGG